MEATAQDQRVRNCQVLKGSVISQHQYGKMIPSGVDYGPMFLLQDCGNGWLILKRNGYKVGKGEGLQDYVPALRILIRLNAEGVCTDAWEIECGKKVTMGIILLKGKILN